MSWFVCSCGFSATKFIEIADKRLCIECGSNMLEADSLPLSFWNKRKIFLELNEEALFNQEKQVLEALKVLKRASDRDIADYLRIDRSSVNGRRNRLMNASIPFIKECGKKIDNKTNKNVTLWTCC